MLGSRCVSGGKRSFLDLFVGHFLNYRQILLGLIFIFISTFYSLRHDSDNTMERRIKIENWRAKGENRLDSRFM